MLFKDKYPEETLQIRNVSNAEFGMRNAECLEGGRRKKNYSCIRGNFFRHLPL